jgi:hypothetical protein
MGINVEIQEEGLADLTDVTFYVFCSGLLPIVITGLF